MIIHAIKFVRKVLRVNQIPNQIPHIKIARSTPRIPRVIENQTASIAIFTVLLITPISSSFHASQPRVPLSKYPKSLFLAILDTIIVKTMAMIANMILSNTCVEKTDNSVLMKSFVCSISASPAASTDVVDAMRAKIIILRYFFIYLN